ncbi:YARHG domain-containing protein [Psychromonas sp.]|uniref:YARHG domain-containing protein n=1 Tax=Psychromonas sp. TaxID=1884585 RepID=UPI0039E3FFB7
MADSAVRLLSKNELLLNNPTELRLMRNEIFARHGFIFKSKDLKRYFSQRSW